MPPNLQRLANVRERAARFRRGGDPLPRDRPEPIAYMIHCIRNRRAPEGLVAMDINVDAVEIIEAAKRSLREVKAVKLPLP